MIAIIVQKGCLIEKENKKAVEINSPQLIKYFYDQTKQTSLLYVLGGIS